MSEIVEGLGRDERERPSRRFHANRRQVVFPFHCYLEADPGEGEDTPRLQTSRPTCFATALIYLAVRRRGTPVQPDQDAVERLLATLRRPLG